MPSPPGSTSPSPFSPSGGPSARRTTSGFALGHGLRTHRLDPDLEGGPRGRLALLRDAKLGVSRSGVRESI